MKNIEELQNLSIDQIFAQFGTSQAGLSSEEAEHRLRVYGYNEFAKRKRRTTFTEFLFHLRNPLVIILLLSGILSFFLGEAPSAVIIFSIVLFSTVLDVYQEAKAEKAAIMLQQKVRTTATVIRDGRMQEVPLAQVVPGDIVHLSAGDIVPADARLIDAKDFFVDQSSLTGESFPVEKAAESPLKNRNEGAESDNYVLLGTSVVSGTATAVIVKTGSATEYGQIAQKLVGRGVETEFERGLRRFGSLMVEVTFLLVLFVFLINALFKRDMFQSLLFAVALAVGLTPELLPMITTINLAKGALAMSKKEVIVKRLESIENLGSMDILCTDKTGTLTENKIKLVLHIDAEGKDSEKVLSYSFLNSHYETGLKSPLDESILGHKGIDVSSFKKIDEVPFDFNRKRVSVIVEDSSKKRFMITKGALEEIVRICSQCELTNETVDLTRPLEKEIEDKHYRLSSQGFRVLGVACKEVTHDKTAYSVRDEISMVFLGFLAFLDPPKATAKESLELLSKDGVELKILTGDNELVTKKICEQLGFKIKGVLLGSEIAQMHDESLSRVVEKTNIFARVTPAQKDRIINALRNNGHVVGFLGDGINDAPSLKTSDVGISVDNAVDVAKESADMILLEKKLRVLHEGVLEGRKTFGNTMKYVLMGSSSNFGNMLSVAVASIFLDFLPMLPVQILLNNLLYDLSESTIPTDNVDYEYVAKPRRLIVSNIRRFMAILGPISSVFDFLTFLTMLIVLNATVSQFQTAWFVESLCTQTLVIFIIRTRKTPFFKSKPSRLLLLSSLGVVAAALAIPFIPGLNESFGFEAPPFQFYLILAGLVSAYVILVEIVKKYVLNRFLH
jgi:Mg2+-importing ATPase